MTIDETLATKLFDEQSLAFLGSVDQAGFPQIRAMMSPRKREGLRKLYFTTDTLTNKIKDYTNNEKACLYLCDATNFQGVLLMGKIEILKSSAYKEMLWQVGDEAFYAGGVTDPNYCVLSFNVEKIRNYSYLESVEYQVPK
ncbi:general stress protein 26 [Enterococcus sp. PF1-24]|uniref:pyridoxamine 5'-phosphate oxidase family protein n=1 Tax=unclassified Enterococcus TaxID=2608891 RepID=UPI002475B69D|nr:MULTISPECIES: pyridoxamine 5'-phosphate oxidase family protein [unclassified Enterococcus]MDH6364195.1 general stress protein 26 [Enterococcus sp. PFB1-1]MDH6401296.1 general stress protein 26 [Enterococcus sp. PF1-24]